MMMDNINRLEACEGQPGEFTDELSEGLHNEARRMMAWLNQLDNDMEEDLVLLLFIFQIVTISFLIMKPIL